MELRDYLRGLRRYWLAVVLMTIVGILAAAGWAALQTPRFEATSSAYIATPQSAKDGESVGGQGTAFEQSFVPTFMSYAAWTSTADYVVKTLGLNAPAEAVIGDISVANTEGTAILNITATAGSPAAAEKLADAWVKGLQVTIDKVDGSGKAGSAPMNVFPGNPAHASSTPVFPDWRTALLVGGIVGLGFGVAFALTRAASDRRIRDADEVAEKLGHAVVGTLPVQRTDGKRHSRGPDPSFAFAESLRVLRTNLQFMDVDNPPRTIVVTSPVPGDGKSTIACELAQTLAASGTPTVLVDGDMRRPTVAMKLGLPAGAGLSDVLAGRAKAIDLLQVVPGTPNLLVLTAGTIPPNPSEILGSERMRSLLAYLAAEATVIIDAPPLLPVTDGAVLAHQADGALLVVTSGKTTYDLAGRSLAALEKVRGRALGIVINKAPMRGADASPYAYAYYEYYSHGKGESGSRNEQEKSGPKRRSTPVEPPAVGSAPIHDGDDPFAEMFGYGDPSAAPQGGVSSDRTEVDGLLPVAGTEPHPSRVTRERSRKS